MLPLWEALLAIRGLLSAPRPVRDIYRSLPPQAVVVRVAMTIVLFKDQAMARALPQGRAATTALVQDQEMTTVPLQVQAMTTVQSKGRATTLAQQQDQAMITALSKAQAMVAQEQDLGLIAHSSGQSLLQTLSRSLSLQGPRLPPTKEDPVVPARAVVAAAVALPSLLPQPANIGRSAPKLEAQLLQLASCQLELDPYPQTALSPIIIHEGCAPFDQLIETSSTRRGRGKSSALLDVHNFIS